MTELEVLTRRLVELGDALDVHDAGIVEQVLERVQPRRTNRRRRVWLVAAAVLLLAAGVALQPDARRAVARWLGLDGVRVEVDRGLAVGPAPTSFDLPGPGESRVVQVDGREILVSTLRGTWDGELLTKTVRSSSQIQQVDVNGHPGMWISGAAHEVFYKSSDGRVAIERVAADTLLWQEDDVLWRVEGFDRLSDALAFAEQT